MPLIAGLLAVVLAAGVGGGYLLFHKSATADEILLEPKAVTGPDPFTLPVSEIPTPEPSISLAPQATPTPTPAPTPRPAPIGPVDANYAIYGGSNNNRVCDKDKLVQYLTTNPDKGSAWATVEGITTAQIPSFIAGLTPTVLTKDIRITNHGFANGKATPRQSVFQAGTAVLADSRGVPVARCLCGNPLLPAQPITGGATPHFNGPSWPAFTPQAIVPITSKAVANAVANPTPAPATAVPLPTASASAGGVASSVPQALNTVQDGGFEAGLVAPWGTGFYEPRPEIFWGAATATATVVHDVVHTGQSSLMIVNRTPASPQVYRTVSQNISVSKGQAYCLAYWGRSQASSNGILSIAVDRAWRQRAPMAAGSYDWRHFSLTFLAEAPTIDIRLISENTGTVWVDDISVTLGPCRTSP